MRLIRGPFRHGLDGSGEQIVQEDPGILGKKAEDEARHEMVHVVAAFFRCPVGVFLQKFDIKTVQARRGLNINRVVFDLLDGRNARQGQEKPEPISQMREHICNVLIFRTVFRLKRHPIRGQQKPCLGRLGLGAFPEQIEGLGNMPLRTNGQMDVVALKHRSGNVRAVILAKPLDRDIAVSERLQELERKFPGIKRCLGNPGDSFFNLNGIHA
nr:hypothetical protein [Acetobacter pasteurianus]